MAGQSGSVEQVIFTNKARCRDCYRCVRECPVKAISMRDGQANVVQERCIGCGTCLRECPQHAKTYRKDVDRAMRLVSYRKRVAVSVAPSFASVLPGWKKSRLASALRQLGFSYIGETALGAQAVADETARIVRNDPSGSYISSACPSVVRYIELYRPELVKNLVPVVSPMIAHARQLRTKLGADTGVVFIGPCISKKLEAERPEYSGLVDAVLTFSELLSWLEDSHISLSECEESSFDERAPEDARFFPVEGGLLRSAGFSGSSHDINTLALSGFPLIKEACDHLENITDPMMLEPLICSRGCINGPSINELSDCFQRHNDLSSFAEHKDVEPVTVMPTVDLGTSFTARPVSWSFPESEIRRILEATGKAREEDQLNCGACGYESCREKAIAVLLGLAEREMCIPRMKRLAIQRSDRIIETSPNGILIVDERLSILHMNPAFRKLFQCSKALLGKPVSALMDPKPFEQLAVGEEQMIQATVEHPSFKMLCHEILYSLPEEHQYIGIFVNVTNDREQEREMDALKEKTVLQARELMEHQLQMVEEIARCLGENTARSQDLLQKLMSLSSNAVSLGMKSGSDE